MLFLNSRINIGGKISSDLGRNKIRKIKTIFFYKLQIFLTIKADLTGLLSVVFINTIISLPLQSRNIVKPKETYEIGSTNIF